MCRTMVKSVLNKVTKIELSGYSKQLKWTHGKDYNEIRVDRQC